MKSNTMSHTIVLHDDMIFGILKFSSSDEYALLRMVNSSFEWALDLIASTNHDVQIISETIDLPPAVVAANFIGARRPSQVAFMQFGRHRLLLGTSGLKHRFYYFDVCRPRYPPRCKRSTIPENLYIQKYETYRRGVNKIRFNNYEVMVDQPLGSMNSEDTIFEIDEHRFRRRSNVHLVVVFSDNTHALIEFSNDSISGPKHFCMYADGAEFTIFDIPQN